MTVPGFPYHVAQQGNRRVHVCARDDERVFFWEILGKYAPKHGLPIWVYCLMTSHAHFVAVPKFKYSLGRRVHAIHVGRWKVVEVVKKIRNKGKK